jgi:hypothetical protein
VSKRKKSAIRRHRWSILLLLFVGMIAALIFVELKVVEVLDLLTRLIRVLAGEGR